MAALTWLGHASFRIESDRGKRIYVDPFLEHNPKTPDGEKQPERVDIIAVPRPTGSPSSRPMRRSNDSSRGTRWIFEAAAVRESRS